VKQLKHQLDLTAANAFGSQGNFKIMKFLSLSLSLSHSLPSPPPLLGRSHEMHTAFSSPPADHNRNYWQIAMQWKLRPSLAIELSIRNANTSCFSTYWYFQVNLGCGLLAYCFHKIIGVLLKWTYRWKWFVHAFVCRRIVEPDVVNKTRHFVGKTCRVNRPETLMMAERETKYFSASDRDTACIVAE
jgi:hypothetical protein